VLNREKADIVLAVRVLLKTFTERWLDGGVKLEKKSVSELRVYKEEDGVPRD
jgi:hypothetical protein